MENKMKFHFCNEISKLINKKLIVELGIIADRELESAIVQELAPFIIPAEDNLKSNFCIHQDIHYHTMSDFYKARNTNVQCIRNLLYGELIYTEGWCELHAAGISIEGKGILLIGPSKSGKSSTAFYMVNKYGGAFISNDTIFIHPKKRIMIGFPEGYGVSRYVGDMLGLSTKTRIHPDYGNYWFTNQHMRNLGYTLKPCTDFECVVFPFFQERKVPVESACIEKVKDAILSCATIVNIDKFENSFIYLDKIPCHKIITYGIQQEYISKLYKG
jgi:hypothetical protein